MSVLARLATFYDYRVFETARLLPANERTFRSVLNFARPALLLNATCSTNQQSLFPTNVHPMADIEYPPKSAGALPQRVRYALKEFC